MQRCWAATEGREGSDSEDSDSEVLGDSPDLEPEQRRRVAAAAPWLERRRRSAACCSCVISSQLAAHSAHTLWSEVYALMLSQYPFSSRYLRRSLRFDHAASRG